MRRFPWIMELEVSYESPHVVGLSESHAQLECRVNNFK
jgi:hypothetical protein